MSLTPNYPTQLSEKLGQILDQVKKSNEPRKSARSYRDPRPSPLNWIEDGVDHINIWEYGKTDLGRALARCTNLPFEHNLFGRFNTLEAFWYYIGSEEHDDRIRSMTGKNLHDFSRRLTRIHVPNFCAIIVDTCWQRVMQYPELIEAFKTIDLPFDSYYRSKKNVGFPIRPLYSAWFCAGMEEVRRAVRENRAPDVSAFRDKGDRSENIYDKLLRLMTGDKKITVAIMLEQAQRAQQEEAQQEAQATGEEASQALSPEVAHSIIERLDEELTQASDSVSSQDELNTQAPQDDETRSV